MAFTVGHGVGSIQIKLIRDECADNYHKGIPVLFWVFRSVDMVKPCADA